MSANILQNVLIIILNYNTYELTLSMIEELRKLDYSSYDILVIDNNSPNNSGEFLSKKSADDHSFIFIQNDKNIGYAAGNNIGLRYAVEHGYKYSWVINNDIIIRDSQVLSHMISILEDHSEYAGIGPMIYTLDDHICGPFCNRPTPLSLTIGISKDLKYRQSQVNISRPVYRLFGCCMLLDNETMKEVDYFDERTFLYCEEDILAERVMMVGKTFYYDSNVSIKHMESSSLRYSAIKLKTNIKYVTDSRNVYMKEYREWNVVIRFLVNTTYALKRVFRNARRKLTGEFPA